MGKTGVTGLRRVWNALFFSLAGLRAAWRHEAAFRQETTLCILLIPVAFWLGSNAIEYSLLVGTLLLVLLTELLNSAVEAVVDRIGDAPHTLSGQAKDMGSAAVLISLLLVVFVWGSIAWQKFYS